MLTAAAQGAQQQATVDLWPIVVGILAAVGAVVSILGGIVAIRRDQRQVLAETTQRTTEDRLWRAEMSATVDHLGATLGRVGAWFDPPMPGQDDRTLPTRMAKLEATVGGQAVELRDLTARTGEHMATEETRWTEVAAQAQEDSREMRGLVRDGNARLNSRIDQLAADQSAAVAEVRGAVDRVDRLVARVRDDMAVHLDDAHGRNRRLDSHDARLDEIAKILEGDQP